ncbi:hypothetical protein KS4_14920 [Poriferisphaera corsica]|uniref:Core-binding (CB) domain-containing protein n=1 Tax=Poriferisphaera corsica TaxID=2528020 RepID=A0A517YT81_9BACT|nr:hypothetical protein KS4_14920 [Poriferisphaera corsica]
MKCVSVCSAYSICYSDVQRFMNDQRKAGKAPRTINGYLQAFKQFCKWAV